MKWGKGIVGWWPSRSTSFQDASEGHGAVISSQARTSNGSLLCRRDANRLPELQNNAVVGTLRSSESARSLRHQQLEEIHTQGKVADVAPRESLEHNRIGGESLEKKLSVASGRLASAINLAKSP
jgi:hypothetical protein